MDETSRERAVAELLQACAEAHHRAFAATDGADDDWASWYADWLLDRPELAATLGASPVRSHLVHALVEADRDRTERAPDEPWQSFYARQLCHRFTAP